MVADGVTAVDAHIDLHFRLGHHDLLADLMEAVQMFKYDGGITGLDARLKVRCSNASAAILRISTISLRLPGTKGVGSVRQCFSVRFLHQGLQHMMCYTAVTHSHQRANCQGATRFLCPQCLCRCATQDSCDHLVAMLSASCRRKDVTGATPVCQCTGKLLLNS